MTQYNRWEFVNPTQLRMHVVVMAVLWSLVQAVVPDCWTGCQLANISVPVETDDGRSCFIETQACAGLCHNKVTLHLSITHSYLAHSPVSQTHKSVRLTCQSNSQISLTHLSIRLMYQSDSLVNQTHLACQWLINKWVVSLPLTASVRAHTHTHTHTHTYI